MVDFEDDIKHCIQTLQQAGTILYPTDTVWGLGCDAMNEKAVEKIFDIKNRPTHKSLIVLLADAKDIIKYVATPHPDIIDIIENFARPTTVIFEHALGFPENVIHQNGSIAIRVTKDPFCKALIKRFRTPIISTSANKTGTPTPNFYSEIDNSIKTSVDYIVKYKQNDHTMIPPSRIIKILDDRNFEIIRP